jgi:hypothetical protein
VKQINVSFIRHIIDFLLTTLLLSLFGALATTPIDAQEQFAKYKWRSGKIEDLSKSVRGFKWGMTQAEIQKVMGKTDDMDETLMAYSNCSVFNADGEFTSKGNIVFNFTQGKLTNIHIHYNSAKLFDNSLQWFTGALGEGIKGAGSSPSNHYWYTWKGDSIKIRMSNSFNQSMNIDWISESDEAFGED